MSVHIRPRSIYLTRHGESEYNRAKLIGGDSGLTPAGRDYSRELRKFMDKENTADLKVWTSSMKRTIQTSAHFQVGPVKLRTKRAFSPVLCARGGPCVCGSQGTRGNNQRTGPLC